MDDKILKSIIDMYNAIMDSKKEFDKDTALQQLGEVAKTTNYYNAIYKR